jgi:hypothetical protein
MKILFDRGARAFLRNFEQVIPLLESRGHVVEQISSDSKAYPAASFPVEEMENDMRLTRKVFYRSDALGAQSLLSRLARDYAWYSSPRLRRSDKCRERCRNMLARGVPTKWQADATELARIIEGLDHNSRLGLAQVLSIAENHLPSDASFEAFLRQRDLDVLLVTPLVFTQYGQVDMVKAAKHLGIPVIYLVYSWDNLTTKGVLHVAPDHVIVWNDIQRAELTDLHGFPSERVTVLGAARFDSFFALKPTPREEFCAARGLDPALPIIAYLGSWSFVAPNEGEFIHKFSRALKQSPELAMRSANLVLKPHPKTIEKWSSADPSAWGLAAICSAPQSNADQLLFDTIYHSCGVVAINTSAELEAAILGKPIFTVQLPEFTESQDGSVHFKYMLRENGGPVDVTRSIGELCSKLLVAIKQESPSESGRFVETFLRPGGRDLPVSPMYVDEIERIVAEFPRSTKELFASNARAARRVSKRVMRLSGDWWERACDSIARRLGKLSQFT